MYPAHALKFISAFLVVSSPGSPGAAGAAPPTLPHRLAEDIAEARVSTAAVAEQIRSFNELYLSKLVSMASSLSALHANTDRLLDRAHVWDTLQLHVAAWTEQMHTLSSKMDLLSRAQENLSSLEARLASLPALDYRLETLGARLEDADKKLEAMSRSLLDLHRDAPPPPLEGQFVARGALATLRGLERKVDSLHRRCSGRGGSSRGEIVEVGDGSSSGPMVVRCHTAPGVMDILRDVSAKVDVLFDQSRPEDGVESEEEEVARRSRPQPHRHEEAGVSDNQVPQQRLRRRGPSVAKAATESSASPEASTETVPTATSWTSWTPSPPDLCSERVSRAMETLTEAVTRVLDASSTSSPACTARTSTSIPAAKATRTDSTGCEDLVGTGLPSGLYSFLGHERFCDMDADGGGWTVVQRRGEWGEPRLNFSRTWAEYREGFGDPAKEFWIGNKWLHRLTQDGAASLRVQLWDWEGEQAVAQYGSFSVLPEADLFRLTVANYSGNATDALAAHSGRPFSTWDANHDEAPSCCPCAPAYAAGWWFYSCFEANLNGEYHTHPEENEYYRGIIWEGWRGDYSLRAASMMVRPATNTTVKP